MTGRGGAAAGRRGGASPFLLPPRGPAALREGGWALGPAGGVRYRGACRDRAAGDAAGLRGCRRGAARRALPQPLSLAPQRGRCWTWRAGPSTWWSGRPGTPTASSPPSSWPWRRSSSSARRCPGSWRRWSRPGSASRRRSRSARRTSPKPSGPRGIRRAGAAFLPTWTHLFFLTKHCWTCCVVTFLRYLILLHLEVWNLTPSVYIYIFFFSCRNDLC